MRKRPWFLLVLALLSGGLAAWLALRYLQQQATPLMAAEPESARIVLAARALPVGTVIGEQDVKTVSWPGGVLPAGYLGSPEEAVGRGVVTRVAENEPLLVANLSTKDAGGGLPIIIRDGMRAMSVRVDEVVGVAGFVLPGTRVDVMLTLEKDKDLNRSQSSTRTILQNIHVLAAGQSVQRDAEGTPQTVSVVTLLVTPDEAELLALAAREGRIQLALRHPLDTATVASTGAREGDLTGTAAAGSSSARRTPRRVVRREPDRVIVEGYRGGERTLTTFRRP